MHIYHDVNPIEREEAIRALADPDPNIVCHALVRLVFHDPDWRWAQDQCLVLLDHKEREVRQLAVTCLGHIARIHGKIDVERVVTGLRRVGSDPQMRGRIDDALDDMGSLMPRRLRAQLTNWG